MPTTLSLQHDAPVRPSQLHDLFWKYRDALLRTATPITGCRFWAEDIVHDAFIRLMETPCKEEIQQPLGYLFRVVRNLAIDKSRRLSLEARYYSDADITNVSVEHTSPERIATEQDSLRRVASALRELPERTQKVFEMHRLNGLTQKQIASDLNISPTLVNFMVRDATLHCSGSLQ